MESVKDLELEFEKIEVEDLELLEEIITPAGSGFGCECS